MARIFYRDREHFPYWEEDTLSPDKYEYVGEIEQDDLGDIYRAMNHVDGSEVEAALQAFGVRSMSPGDIAVTDEGIFLCARSGWKDLYEDPATREFSMTLGANNV